MTNHTLHKLDLRAEYTRGRFHGWTLCSLVCVLPLMLVIVALLAVRGPSAADLERAKQDGVKMGIEAAGILSLPADAAVFRGH